MKNVNKISLGNAFIWTAAILAVAILNHWSGSEVIVLAVLGGAAGASITIVSNALRKE
jgi:hypothetical protein